METAPFHAEIAYGPDGGAGHWLVAEDGVRIRAVHWPAGADAKGTVLIFPGRTEYAEKYGDTARMLVARGYAAIAVDWRGQGLADRLLDDRGTGHVGAFTDYQHDVRALVAAARELNLPEPFHLIAHSMGGCIGLRALMEGLPVTAAAFSAPMWGIRISALMRPVAWGLSTIARPLRFGHRYPPGQVAQTYVLLAEFEDNTLTRDREMFERLQGQLNAHPEMALGGPSLHWLNEALREMRGLVAQPSPDVPCITFLGGAEKIVDPARVHDRMARWPRGTLDVIDGAEHEVLMEVPEVREAAIDRACALFADPGAPMARSA